MVYHSLDQVFNCDETGLYYKLFPQKSLPAHFEKSPEGRKTQKERVIRESNDQCLCQHFRNHKAPSAVDMQVKEPMLF